MSQSNTPANQTQETAKAPTFKVAGDAYSRELGWAVLPEHDVTSGVCSCSKGASCGRSSGKHPRINNWQTKATTEAQVIDAWAGEFPNAGIGVATGKPSGFFVLDVDGDEGRASLAKHGDLPVTVHQKTGGGNDQYFFKLPDFEFSNSAKKIAPGLDIRTTGGQVVLPPSISGKGRYSWVRSPFRQKIADAPGWLLERLRPRVAAAGPVERGEFPPASPDVLAQAREALDALGPAVSGEGGDDKTFRACAMLRHDFALTFDEAWAPAWEWNASNAPPWSDEDLAAKLRGGERYGTGEYGSKRKADVLQRAKKLIADWRESGTGDLGFKKLGEDLRAVAVAVDPIDKRAIEDEWVAETTLTRTALALPKAIKPRPASLTPHTGPDFDIAPTTGAPIPNVNNGVIALEHERSPIHFDAFRGRILKGDGAEWTDADTLKLTVTWQSELGLTRIAPQVVHDAVTAFAHAHATDSMREGLTGLVWDGTDRIASFFTTAFGAADSEYTRAASSNLWKAMVARALKPGCKADEMVVLEGAQGTYKSTALRIIAGAENFGESSESPHSKDFFLALIGRLIVEIGELDSFSRAEVAAVKRVLSCREDRYRPPYGRVTQDFPRRGIFVGTTNRSDWARDDTGGRRFWPIKCGKVDLEYIKANREQLFAEAVARIATGEKWHEMPLEATQAEQEARRQVDPWEERLGAALANVDQVTMEQVFDLHVMVEVGRRDRAHEMRAAMVLRRLGFEKVEVWADGRKRRVWKRSGGKAGGNAATH